MLTNFVSSIFSVHSSTNGSIKITDDDILKIIAKLDPNKAHGHDKMSIRMIKICSTSICKPLRLIFNHCIDSGIYPCKWEKANVVPIHKKGDKQTLKNYCPVSLLPICSKSFERLIYNEVFGFFLDKSLISANQSGFKPGDSYINQLLSITHNIINHLMVVMKLEVFFLTFQKHLIRSGTMVLFLNYKKMEHQATY